MLYRQTDHSADTASAFWKKRWLQAVFGLAIVAIVLECVFFQWASFASRSAGDAVVVPAEKQVLAGFTRDEAWPKRLIAGDTAVHSISVSTDGRSLRTVYLDAYSNYAGPLKFSISVVDPLTGSVQPLAMGQVVSGIERSRTIRVGPSGPVQSIRIDFELKRGEQVHLNRLILDRKIPYQPNGWRFLLMLLSGIVILSLLMAPVFLLRADQNDPIQRVIISVVCFLIFVSCMWLTTLAATFPIFNVSRTDGDLYNKELVDALIAGQPDLLVSPDPALTALGNPYDPVQRSALPSDAVLWDAALFEGRYFVSYGVLPAALFMAPFKEFSGYYFQTPWAVFLFGALSLLLLVRNLRRFLFILFPELTFRYHFILCLVMPALSYAGWTLARPKFYELAILGGFFFVMLGLDQLMAALYGRAGRPDRMLLWDAALATDSTITPPHGCASNPTTGIELSGIALTSGVSSGSVKTDSRLKTAVEPDPVSGAPRRIGTFHLFCALLFFTMAVGCQSSFALFLVPVTLILIHLIRRSCRTRQTVEVLLFSAVAIAIPAIPLARYNLARFGSILEFGDRFRLTVLDLTSRGWWSPERILPGLVHYLLTPPRVNLDFPFIHFPTGRFFSSADFPVLDGRAIGLLFFPFITILLIWPLVRQGWRLADRPQRQVFAGCGATALMMVAFVSMTQGGVARQMVLFAIWVAVPAMLTWLLLIPDAQQKGREGLHFKVFLVVSVLTLFFCAMLFLQGENDRIESQSPWFYELVRRSLAVWLP